MRSTWYVRFGGPAPTETFSGLSVSPRATWYISPSRAGMPRLTSPVTAVPPQSCIHAAWLGSDMSPDSSMPLAIGLGSLALLKPPRRSYQYQTNEPMAPPYWS